MKNQCDAIIVLSGGMDSAVLLWWAIEKLELKVKTVSVNYGQRHSRELKSASCLSSLCGAEHYLIDLSSMKRVLPNNALTGDIEIPEGHYAEPNMMKTVVPNRNMMLISVALSIAGSSGANKVMFGAHAGDHPVYPDCRPEFVERMNEVASVCWYEPIQLSAPFVQKSKANIVELGDAMGVPWEETWSCYKGGEIHCGLCGTCVERREAFMLAEVIDPTEYEDETPIEELMAGLA